MTVISDTIIDSFKIYFTYFY